MYYGEIFYLLTGFQEILQTECLLQATHNFNYQSILVYFCIFPYGTPCTYKLASTSHYYALFVLDSCDLWGMSEGNDDVKSGYFLFKNAHLKY